MADYSDINYSDITFNDRNPVKRLLQHDRISHSLLDLQSVPINFQGQFLDYGAGNGELAKRLAVKFPESEIYCYEPSAVLREQAGMHLTGEKIIRIVPDISTIAADTFDFIFCLEVFEHLPPEQIQAALKEINRLAKPTGKIIIGVPNEIFLAALLKGLFRMTRRFGEVDARPGNILRAFFGKPPGERPVVSFDHLPYIIRHMGFDHRRFGKLLNDSLVITKTYGSPFPALPLWMNFEVYFICKPS
ncbi:MAG TPA: class I SAM-dependent methyltransferase [Caldithrix sp.]|nr:class I SAM-dependent methyltransferase [Caldithrix sp.]